MNIVKKTLSFFSRRRKESPQQIEDEGTKEKKIAPPPPSPPKVKPQVVKVSDEIELTIEGLPSTLQGKQRNKVLASLVGNTLTRLPDRPYKKGERLHQGQAHLQIEDEIYDIVYALDVTRAIAALEVYKQAFDAVSAGAAAGIYDKELAEMTADYLKESAWEEIQPTKHSHKEYPLKSNEPKIILLPPEEQEK